MQADKGVRAVRDLMRFQWFVLLLLGGLAYGQAAAPSAPETKVAPTDPVITLKGFCDDPGKQGDSCRTVITREQFEKTADALQPNMSPAVRRQLAAAYSKMLAMSSAAEKKGLDKQPQFNQMMKFARMQILSQVLSRNLQEESGKVSDSDLEKYYSDNQHAYDQATLLRIFVPQEKAGEATMKELADSLHARAANGEDFEKLQNEAYVGAGIQRAAPPVKMDKVRRTALPTTQSKVFDLQPGLVSELMTESSGFYIYKLVSKQTLPLDAVKIEIKNTISSQRYRDSMQAVEQQATPELNNAYFGSTRGPANLEPGLTQQEGRSSPPGIVPSVGQESPPVEVREGQTPQEVEKVLGKPSDAVALKGGLVYIYPTVKVIFENGKLVDVQYQQK